MTILPLLFALALHGSINEQSALVNIQATTAESVKVFANTEGGLTVRSSAKQPLTFYLFDVEGALLYQTTIKQHESKTIDGLTKGTYSYSAFQNDESVEEGKVTLK